MSGTQNADSRTVNVLQDMDKALQNLFITAPYLATIATALQGLVAAQQPPVSTVALLPASGLYIGQQRYASNGRANTSQGSGAGTGTPVFWNGTAWISFWSGLVVTA